MPTPPVIETAFDRSGRTAPDTPVESAENGETQRDFAGQRADDGEPERRSRRSSPGANRLAGNLVLTPGMPGEAHIRTEERTVMSFLVKPVTDFFYRSLREE